MNVHPTRDQIELYVIGGPEVLAREEIDELERHFIVCDHCAKELMREARAEQSIADVARAASFCPGCKRVWPASAARCDHCGAARAPGGYVVEEVLAHGPHGRIYLAIDPSGRRVALKELVFTQVPSLATVEAFEKEGRILQQLQHPRIPTFHASFTEGEGVHTRLYLAQEHVEGDSLGFLLERHRYDEAEAKLIAEQVLEVLVYLQTLSPQVFHRDVKPANLICRPDGSIVLVDFGSARELGPTASGTLAGTFGYMPPEQLVGIVDATSDPYALGATLLHLLGRRVPWGLHDRRGGRPPKITVSRSFERWLERLVAEEPEQRFASAAEALGALRSLDVKRRWARPLALASVAACAAATVVVVMMHDGADRVTGSTAPPQPRMGTLSVRSHPPGATIVIDGKQVLAKTPAEVSKLLVGETYQLRLERDGYRPWDRRVLILGGVGQPQPLDAVLEPSESTLVINVPVDYVAEARVFIDGEEVEVAETIERRVSLGEHRLQATSIIGERRCQLDAAEYALLTKAREVFNLRCYDRGVPARPVVEDSVCGTRPLDRSRPGYITVNTVPYSRVYWKDTLLGETPLAKLELPSGCLVLRFVAPESGVTKNVTVEVLPTKNLRYQFEMR